MATTSFVSLESSAPCATPAEGYARQIPQRELAAGSPSTSPDTRRLQALQAEIEPLERGRSSSSNARVRTGLHNLIAYNVRYCKALCLRALPWIALLIQYLSFHSLASKIALKGLERFQNI
jgi:hypothetical protein